MFYVSKQQYGFCCNCYMVARYTEQQSLFQMKFNSVQKPMSYRQQMYDRHHWKRFCKTIHSITKIVCYETGTYKYYNTAQPA